MAQRSDFSRIHAAVDAAFRDEERTSRLRNALRNAHGATEASVTAADAQLGFVRAAIAAVPERLETAAALDVGPDASRQVARVLRDIIAYWDEPSDVLPDEGGLIGLVDDALVAHLLLSRLHRWLLETEGQELSALAGHLDLDLRRVLVRELDVLLASIAADVWEHGFDQSRVARAKWTSAIFAGPPREAALGPVRGQRTAPPTTAASPSAGAAPGEAAAEPNDGPRLYDIWFGTNRVPLDPKDPGQGFGGVRDERVHYGVCEVAIPKSHKFGSTGTAWWRRWLRLEFADDHIKVVKRRTIEDADAFFGDLREELASGEGNQLLFYLHGFNVSFDDAAIRAAQLFADLKVSGATAFFSWPSKASVNDYFADVERIAESESAIAAFLTGLCTQLGGATVHIIAHSMGNRGLARAIQRITAAATGRPGVRFGQIILAAPDVSIGLFHDLARVYPTVSTRTTMYVSARDRALGVSQWLQDAPRAGFTPPVTIVPNIDTIEVSNIDVTMLGHGYYAEAEPVLYDIASLLRNDAAPGQRPRLQASGAAGSADAHWVIGT